MRIDLPEAALPAWVPAHSLRYLAHTESGCSIREIARAAACHPSTVLRQIRRLEGRRDDPLVDAALTSLGRRVAGAEDGPIDGEGRPFVMNTVMERDTGEDVPSDAELAREAVRVLRRLCETGAVLALAADMDKAVVVRDGPGGGSARTAVVDRAIAQAMALKEWITAPQAEGRTPRITRYSITPAGRAALSRKMAEEESRRASDIDGLADAHAPFDRDSTRGGKNRYTVGESPLGALARRRDRDGKLFLSDDLVAAGERLREDFELCQVSSEGVQNWERMLTAGVTGGVRRDTPKLGARGAQDRLQAALQDLGPGLSDVALRVCCQLEGLESAERRMGWSARSGKIVLRIALQRLKRHYDELSETDQMIG